MSRLVAAIAKSFAEFPRDALVELCETADPGALADRCERWAREHLGAAVVDVRHFGLSVGPVAGLVLADGRVAVIKAHPARVSRVFLEGMHRVQRHLVSNGFPCPEPIAGPLPFGSRLATADTWLDDAGHDFGGGAMRASATGLAAMIASTREVDARGIDQAMMQRSPGARYPRPHSPLFDFARPDPRAARIDALADRALVVIDALDVEPVIAHGDWSARNVRFGPAGVRGVYDWDSLVLAPEAVAVGIAAATWRSFGEAGDPIAPDAAEVSEYLAQYEAARAFPFAAAERAAVLAQALYVLCYTARCEMSLGPGHPVRATARLASDTAALAFLTP